MLVFELVQVVFNTMNSELTDSFGILKPFKPKLLYAMN